MRNLDEVHRIAAYQFGVITRQQCLAAQLTVSTIRTLLATGRWQRIHSGVYSVTTGRLDEDAEIQAALLAIGPLGVASHETALWMLRRVGPMPRPITVSVPVRSCATAPAGVRLHRLARLRAVGSPAHMVLEQAIAEVVHLRTDPRQVVTLVCDQIGARMTTPQRLRDELAGRPRQRWRGLLDSMLAEVALGAHSDLEIRDLHNDRAHGLPAGLRQVKHRAGGERRWLDALVRLTPDGQVVVKELDGRLGHEGTKRFRDARRDNASVLTGGHPLRFGWADLAHDPCEVAALQALLWRRLGHPGVGHPCQYVECRLEARVTRLAKEHPRIGAAS